jgi:hypothetical protein
LLIILTACGKVRDMGKHELTTKEAAAHLQESDRLVRLWCQQGRFPRARRVEHPRGDYWVIPLRDIETFTKPKPGPVPKVQPSSTEPPATRQPRASVGASTKKRGSKK